MENPTYIGLTRQLGLQRKLEVTANNLANAETDGFKAERTRFHDLVVNLENTGNLAFSSTVNISRDHSEGTVRITHNPLDIAIQGEGYFAVDTGEGDLYTRHGRFTINENNELVTVNGHAVLNQARQAVLVPLFTQNIIVSGDGLVSAGGEEIDQIGIFRFENEQALEKLSDTLFRANDQQAIIVDNARVSQGALEGSNVEAISELVQLIDLQRAFERTAKLIENENRRQLNAIDRLTNTN